MVGDEIGSFMIGNRPPLLGELFFHYGYCVVLCCVVPHRVALHGYKRRGEGRGGDELKESSMHGMEWVGYWRGREWELFFCCLVLAHSCVSQRVECLICRRCLVIIG